ncbi:MAG: M20/M25/M40 family metallo-hydrolase [Candidatus Margulisbacteria bacterium]|jgi:tripeptide aminopeptidase|nr:M20/M25/M40 family metallo-hydrolase [Candidatus Margulisiibacteriota bacterium]
MINKRRLVKTFKELVRIDSLSLREAQVARYVRRELRKLGIRSVQVGKPRGGDTGNMVSFVSGQGPLLLLNAHLDTVSPGRNIKPREKRGVICSDGTTVLGADNKAGVAAILEVLRTIKEQKLPHPHLQIIFTVAEEIGLVGAKNLSRSVLKAAYGLALDGGQIDKLLNAAPSQINLTATIIGKAAHAGVHPEAGVNAIRVASEAIAAMKIGRIDRETTANIGVIRGGKATNIIPAEVELRGEARSHDRAKLRRQVKAMTDQLRKACRRHGARLRLTTEQMYRSFAVRPDSPIVKLVLTGMKKERLRPQIKPSGGGSDANIFNARGVPTLVIGVGARQLHTTGEELVIRDFIRGTELLLTIIREAAGG